jgi:hypothetical protein
MERIELVYEEYKRLCERRDKLLDKSFNDFKLLGAIGSTLVIFISIFKNNFLEIVNELNLEIIDKILIFTIMFLVFSIIAIRDLIINVYISHTEFDLYKIEKILKRNFHPTRGLFENGKSWRKKFFKIRGRVYATFTVYVLFLVYIIILFIFSKELQCLFMGSSGFRYEWIFLIVIPMGTFFVYSWLIRTIYKEIK